MAYCAIDFGTSNSAVALPLAAGSVRLAPVEGKHTTLPTAIFYHLENAQRDYGRAAVTAYTEGHEGRLMRSLKSILGSQLVDQSTHLGDGITLRYIDLIAAFIKHLKGRAEEAHGAALDQVVLGRPVHFVDDDAGADRAAEAALQRAARAAGFQDIAFQFEPIAAAFDYEATLEREELVFICDIGGGTSDFSLIRVGPERCARLERAADVLANDGVHIAGTDFDRQVELWGLLPAFGYGSVGPTGRPVPHRVYYDLATWHLINTLYTPKRMADLRGMRYFYGDERQHRRLMSLIERRLGHWLLERAEYSKIEVAEGRAAEVSLAQIEEGLAARLEVGRVIEALTGEVERICNVARRTVALAGTTVDEVHAVYFTGGSTGLSFLAERLHALFPNARAVHGERFASVVSGLGLYAERRYGGAAPSR